jgi:S-adenosyl methyltransferase
MAQAPEAPAGVDETKPSPARVYDYLLGGKTNFPADQLMGEKMKERAPELVDSAWANRGFHQRAAKWIAEQGIHQFIDIGPGLPTVGNTHEVVQKVNIDARVAYVDNDPMVLAYGAALLEGAGGTRVVLGDLRDPDDVLTHPEVREVIRPGEPTGLLMTAVAHFVADEGDPWSLVARYLEALGSGSYLALSHMTGDKKPPLARQVISEVGFRAAGGVYLRSKAQIERFFTGLELVAPYKGARPGLVHVGEWGAEDVQAADTDGSRWLYCGVAKHR